MLMFSIDYMKFIRKENTTKVYIFLHTEFQEESSILWCESVELIEKFKNKKKAELTLKEKIFDFLVYSKQQILVFTNSKIK